MEAFKNFSIICSVIMGLTVGLSLVITIVADTIDYLKNKYQKK